MRCPYAAILKLLSWEMSTRRPHCLLICSVSAGPPHRLLRLQGAGLLGRCGGAGWQLRRPLAPRPVGSSQTGAQPRVRVPGLRIVDVPCPSPAARQILSAVRTVVPRVLSPLDGDPEEGDSRWNPSTGRPGDQETF